MPEGSSLYDIFVSLKVEGFDKVARQLKTTEERAESTEKSLSGLGDGTAKSAAKTKGSLGQIASALKDTGKEADKLSRKSVTLRTKLQGNGQVVSGLQAIKDRSDQVDGANATIKTSLAGSRQVLSDFDRIEGASTRIDGDTVTVTTRVKGGEEGRRQIEQLSVAASKIDGDDLILDAEVRGVASAVGELSTLSRIASALDGKEIDVPVDVDTGGAIAGMTALRAVMAGVSAGASSMGSGVSAGGVRIAMIGSIAATAAALFTPLLGALASVGSLGAAAGAGIGLIAAPLAMVIGRLKEYHTGLEQAATAQKSADSAARSHSDALAGVAKAQAAAAQTAQDGARAIGQAEGNLDRVREDGARSIREAEASLARTRADGAAAIKDAERNLAEVRRSGADAIADAEQDLRRTRASAAQAIADAERNLADTRRSVAENNARAEEDLAEARLDNRAATEDLVEAEQELKDIRDGDEARNQQEAEDQLTRAKLDLTEAQRDENEAIRQYGADSLEARQAALDVREAERNLAEQQEETNEIRSQGSEELRRAQENREEAAKRQQEAAENERTAEENLQNTREQGAREERAALEELNRTRRESAQSVRDAEKLLSDARDDSAADEREALRTLRQARASARQDELDGIGDVNAARRAAARSEDDALRALSEARRQAAQQNAAAQAAVTEAQKTASRAAEDLAAAQAEVAAKTVSLPPALMALYNAAMRFKAAANTAFGPAQNAISRLGVTILRDVTPALDVLGRASTATIGALSRSWDGFMQKVREPVQQRSFATMLGITPDVIQSLASAVGNIVLTLANVFAAAAPSALALAGHIERITNSTLRWSQSASGVGAVRSAIAAATPVFSALWNMVKQVGGALFQFGVTNAPAIATAIRWVSQAVTWLINGFSGLTQVFGPIVPVALALTPIFLGMALIFGQLLGFLAPLGAAVAAAVGFFGGWAAVGTALYGVLGPIALVVAGVAAAAVLLYKNWGRVKQILAPLVPIFNRVKSTIQNLGTVIKGLFTGSTGTEQFRQAFARLPGPIQTAIKKIVTALRSIKTSFQQVWNQVKPILSAVGNGIQKGVVTALRFLIPQVKRFVSSFRSGFQQVKSAVLPVLTAIANGIRRGAGAAFRFLLSQAKVIVNWFRKNWPLIKQTALTVFNAFKEVITKTLRFVWNNVIRPIVQQIVRFFRANWGTIQRVFKAAWDIIKTTVSTAIKAVLGIIKAVMQAINGDWKGAWNTIKGVVKTVLQAMKSNIDNVLEIIKGIVKVAWNAIKDVTGGVWNALKKITSAAWDAIKNFIGDKLDAARARVKTIREDLAAGLKTAWESIKKAASDAWTAISGAIWRPIETAYNKVTEFIDKIKGAVNAVLRLVGLPELGSGDSGGGAPKGGAGSPTRDARARRSRPVRGYAEGGRVRERPGGVYRVAEGGQDEWVVNPNSRNYERHLRGAAAEGGYTVQRAHRGGGDPRVPASVRRGLFPPWRAGGASADMYPTMHTYIPEMRKFVDEANAKFPIYTNTYAGHPPPTEDFPQPYYRERSVDFWGTGGRGSDLSDALHEQTVPWTIERLGSNLNWLISNGRMLTNQGWGPDTSGFDHYSHQHTTAFADGPTATGGGSGANLKATVFEAAWNRLVRPIVDTFLGPLKNSPNVMAQFAGAAAQKVPDGIKQWAMDKLGSMGGLSGGSGLSGTPAQNRALGEKMFPNSGLPGQFSDVDAIWTQESGWDHTAQNPTSSAFGIPQFLDSTWQQYGGVSKDAEGQIKKGFMYIGDRYGSTGEALSFKQANGWYDKGGLIRREHQAVVHPNELYLPLDRPNVMQTAQTALGTAELRAEIGGLRQDMQNLSVRVSGYGDEAKETIVVGARQGGLGAIESGEGGRIVNSQVSRHGTTGRRAGATR